MEENFKVQSFSEGSKMTDEESDWPLNFASFVLAMTLLWDWDLGGHFCL